MVQGGGEEKQIENFTEARSQWVVGFFSISGGVCTETEPYSLCSAASESPSLQTDRF